MGACLARWASGSRIPRFPDHGRMKSSTSRRPNRSAVLQSPPPWPGRCPADGVVCQGPVSGPVGGPFRVPVAGHKRPSERPTPAKRIRSSALVSHPPPRTRSSAHFQPFCEPAMGSVEPHTTGARRARQPPPDSPSAAVLEIQRRSATAHAILPSSTRSPQIVATFIRRRSRVSRSNGLCRPVRCRSRVLDLRLLRMWR